MFVLFESTKGMATLPIISKPGGFAECTTETHRKKNINANTQSFETLRTSYLQSKVLKLPFKMVSGIHVHRIEMIISFDFY